jgi:hypothetical protein
MLMSARSRSFCQTIPANGTRIQTLEKHFRDNPSTFSNFSRDPKSATSFSVPKDATVIFLRADTKGKN